MRRERRGLGKSNLDFKRILYIAGGILSISIITFISIFILNGVGGEEQQQIAKFNTSIVNEYQTNMLNDTDFDNTTEEASSQMGKTVNEVEESEASSREDENTVIQEETEGTTKYAVNTSNMEENTVKESNASAKQEETAVEEKVEEKEEVKDPEFKRPVEGDIIREYAKENLVYSATLDEWITHNGIDLAAEKTSVVRASADGTVKSIKNDPRYGLTVVIEHTNGFQTIYSNLLTAEFVEEGEEVKQGDTIATVGNTATFEIADESHLHFEILKNNESLDPELYLK
jgi:murein DD-endopeptidase MepM/ murein hydrolase activator NlpD